MGAILIISTLIGSILAIRLFGSWMFRINIVIDELKEINKQLKNK